MMEIPERRAVSWIAVESRPVRVESPVPVGASGRAPSHPRACRCPLCPRTAKLCRASASSTFESFSMKHEIRTEPRKHASARRTHGAAWRGTARSEAPGLARWDASTESKDFHGSASDDRHERARFNDPCLVTSLTTSICRRAPRWLHSPCARTTRPASPGRCERRRNDEAGQGLGPRRRNSARPGLVCPKRSSSLPTELSCG